VLYTGAEGEGLLQGRDAAEAVRAMEFGLWAAVEFDLVQYRPALRGKQIWMLFLKQYVRKALDALEINFALANFNPNDCTRMYRGVASCTQQFD
jgi:hypothetical protein